MGAQHPELAADGGGTTPSFLVCFRRCGVEQRLKVSITKSGNVELAAIDNMQGGQRFSVVLRNIPLTT
jgi:hypothetical protein